MNLSSHYLCFLLFWQLQSSVQWWKAAADLSVSLLQMLEWSPAVAQMIITQINYK